MTHGPIVAVLSTSFPPDNDCHSDASSISCNKFPLPLCVSGLLGSQTGRGASLANLRYANILERLAFLVGLPKTQRLASLSAFGDGTRRRGLRVSGQRSSPAHENGLPLRFR